MENTEKSQRPEGVTYFFTFNNNSVALLFVHQQICLMLIRSYENDQVASLILSKTTPDWSISEGSKTDI